MSIEAIPTQTAISRALEIVMANPIYGGRYNADNLSQEAIEKNMSFYIEFGRGWAISCNLSVELIWTLQSEDSKAKVHVTWPANAYDIARAQASIALHQEVTNLAALLQASLDEMNILSLRASIPQ